MTEPGDGGRQLRQLRDAKITIVRRLLGEGRRRLKAPKKVVDDRREEVKEPIDEDEVNDGRKEKSPVNDFSPVAQESKDIDCDSHVDLCVIGYL